MPDRGALLGEPVEQLGRLDPLDDREQAMALRSAIHAPPHSHPPRCGSARITPLPAREAGLDVLEALDREVRGDRARAHLGRQPEHLEPVATVRVEDAVDAGRVGVGRAGRPGADGAPPSAAARA